jgi:hypothetical protein
MTVHEGRFDEPIDSTTAAAEPRNGAAGPPPPSPSQVAEPGRGDSLPVTVRQLRPLDVPRLRRLEPLHVLDRPESTAVGWRPLRGVMSAAAPFARQRRPAFVVEAGDRLVGFARFQTAAPDERWILLALGAAMGVYAVDPVWEALLTTAVRQAGLRGVRSLFARVPWSTGLSPVLTRLHWQPYASETVFLADDLRASRRDALRPRPMRPSDTWAVHQLYAAVAPYPVQQAEAFTSRRWESAARGPRARICGYLFEDGWQTVGLARVVSGSNGRVLDLLIHPERRNLAGRMLDGALAALSPGRQRVWATVRGYQDELATPLQERGFLPVFEQELFVRYTTARVRRPVLESVPFVLDVRERATQQAPTFVTAAPKDGTAS